MKKLILILFVAIVLVGCKKDKKDLSVIEVGQDYQGGIVFFIDGSGRHGLIASRTDQSSGIRWYNGIYVDTHATSIEDGKSNTEKIVSAQLAGDYAASICANLVLNGYSDWYLPSSAELNKLYGESQVVGGFSQGDYWSSSEITSGAALYQPFGLNSGGAANKLQLYRVRAIRSF